MKTIPLEKILVKDSSYNRNQLRKRLIAQNILMEVCASCGIGSEWNNKKLTLQLEHKNGVPNDNRIENLELLCPNCHSQTDTFAGRKLRKPKNTCKQCKKEISKQAKHCFDCYPRPTAVKNRRKIDWPPLEKIEQMLKDSTYVKVAEELGVSDSAVRKFVKRRREEKLFGGTVWVP